MKIVMKILGVLLLVGGLALVGLTVTNDFSVEERFYRESSERLEAKEKKIAQATATEEEKKEFETARKNNDAAGKMVSDKKQTQTIAFVIGGFLSVLGIALFAGSFIFGNRAKN